MGPVCEALESAVSVFLETYCGMGPEELTRKRYQRFREM